MLRPIDRWFIDEVLPHESVLLSVAQRLCSSHEDARDLVQDVFARMMSTQGWAAIDNPRAFMIRTMRNLAIERMRRARIVDFRQIVDAEHLDMVDDTPDPQQIAEGREAMADFQHALDQLPERCRTVFIRRRIEEQSPRDIAADLNLSLSTLEKRLARAIQLITRALEPRRRAEYVAPDESAEIASAE